MIDGFINQYGKRLYGLCMTLCADSSEADDLYQETWLKAVAHFSKYDPARPFEPWLTKICVNIYRNTLRRYARSPILVNFASNEEKDSLINSVPAPALEDYSTLHDAINRLPRKYRMTIILFYFRDMEISKTAQILNIPPGTVKSRLNKAKKLLKDALKDETDIQF